MAIIPENRLKELEADWSRMPLTGELQSLVASYRAETARVGITYDLKISDIPEKLERKIAEAIWVSNGGILRLLDEAARTGSNLNDQQRLCWKQAKAVVAALVT